MVKELSGDPLQFLPRMHGAASAEGGEGNEYLEKFMAIRKDDLGLTPPRRASQDDVGSQEKALPVALYRDSTIGYWVPRIVLPLKGISSLYRCPLRLRIGSLSARARIDCQISQISIFVVTYS